MATVLARRRRIVISINTAWNIANFRAGLIKAMISDGYEVVAVAPADDHTGRLEQMGCRFIPLAMDNQGTNPWRDLALFMRYLRILQRERPMAFLGYTIKPNVYGSLAAQRLGIPVINNVSGLGTAFIRNTWMTRVVKWLYRRAFAASHLVFFQNTDDQKLFVEGGLVEARRTAVLPGSGVDLDHFRPIAPPAVAPNGSTQFLLIGRVLWDKGVGEYVDAARIVRKVHPNATFAILGFLDVENRTAVPRDRVQAWQAEGVVSYLGSANDVRPHIAAADCVVLPSYREGTPKTLLEAAAMGKPLIATDVPGCRDVVEDSHNGFLCEVKSGADLAAKMIKFLNLPDFERLAMGQASRRKAEQEFDEQFVIKRYLSELKLMEYPDGRTSSA